MNVWYIRKRSGPRTESYGTPYSIQRFSRLIFLTLTNGFRFVSTFMRYNLHRKIKLTITRYFKGICVPGEKIKMKK